MKKLEDKCVWHADKDCKESYPCKSCDGYKKKDKCFFYLNYDFNMKHIMNGFKKYKGVLNGRKS